LRYLWGITGLATFALLMLSAIVSTFLEAL
jgi:hypothetical protein